MSQQGLADKAGMGRAHLTRLEGGKRSPRWDTIEKLAAALSCTATDLIPPPTEKRAPSRKRSAIARRGAA